MLISLCQTLFATTTPALRRLGARGDAVALWSRANRRRTIWAPHEAECHAIVRAAIARLPTRQTVMVLGSGLCRDVPTVDLAAQFAQVVLVDAVHLPLTRWRLRHLKNLHFITEDITGAAAWVTGMAQARQPALEMLFATHHPDLVISANCLSQLPMAVENWLDAHPARMAQLPPMLADQLVGWHLDDLADAPCPVCLLTDVDMEVRNKAGTVVERLDFIAPFSLPKPDAEWFWTVAPFGEESRHTRRIHRCHGFIDLAASRRGA